MVDNLSNPSIPTYFQNYCRICAENANALINLFIIRKKGISLAEMISRCTQLPILPEDDRPSNICSKCAGKLDISYNFFNLARKSEEKFQQMILSLHTEPMDPKPETLLLAEEVVADGGLFVEDFKIEVKNELTETLPQSEVAPRNRLGNKQSGKGTKVKRKANAESVKLNCRDKERLQFECYKCKQELSTLRHLRSHMREHKNATPHRCTICQMYFSNKQFARHLCQGNYIQCEYCYASFTSTNKLLTHLDIHENEKKVYKCTECAKFFPMKSLFTIHFERHNDVKKSQICSICEKHFKNKSALSSHMSTHTDERPHLCNECGAGFKKLNALQSHMKRHMEIRPYGCPHLGCTRRFLTTATMRSHMDVHNNTKYVCHLCDATLNSHHSLEEHRRIRHKKVREWSCDVCSMKFTKVYNLKRHKFTHTGEKPFRCTFCPRDFTQKNDLVKHTRSHVGENTYQCESCPMSFRFHAELRNHTYEHNQDQTSSK